MAACIDIYLLLYREHIYAIANQNMYWDILIWYVELLHFKELVINYGEGGGGLQNGEKLFAPPPPHQEEVILFAPPHAFKGYKLVAPPPFSMAKTSSYSLRTTPKPVPNILISSSLSM